MHSRRDHSPCTSEQDDGDLPHLDVSDWDPPPKSNASRSASSSTGSRANGNGPKENGLVENTRHLTYGEIIHHLEMKIKDLLQREDYIDQEVRKLLKFIQRQTRYNPDIVLNRRVTEKIVKLGIAHVFLRVWKSITRIDFLEDKNPLAFKNLQTTLSIVWNCSDKSASLCDSLSRCGLIHLFMNELECDRLTEADFSDENLLYLVKAYLGILHNIIRMCSDSRKLFRHANAVEILQNYTACSVSLVRTKAYLILAYIINEEENSVIHATDENIKFFLDILDNALDSENHFSKAHAFWAVEIACGLNHLAISDKNKVRLGRLGAFPLYLKLLQSENVDEQNLGAAGLWILSFNEDNKILLRSQSECLEVLESLAANSTNGTIRRAARGALWVVKSAPPSQQTSISTTPERSCSVASPVILDDISTAHIMVSYHWSVQETMIKLKDKLRSAGFKIWMDVDNMTGSTLEAMALAVEKSVVVLVCMSQEYKDSPSCRTEAEYTYRLHKDVIPLLLQPDYVPDGWLGLLVGTRLHFDFSRKEKMNSELQRLIKELGNRGRLMQNEQSVSYDSLDTGHHMLQSCMSVSSVHSYVTKSQRIGTWDCDDVHCWLEEQGLAELADKLVDLDGPLLLQYKKMMDTAPQYFYHTLEDILGLKLKSILQFTKLLDAFK